MDKLIIEFNKKFDKQKQELIDGFKALGEEKRLPKALATVEGEQPTYKNYFKAGWQSRQAEVDELSSQNQILKEVAESDMKTIERLESVINLNDSELKEKDKRIEELERSCISYKNQRDDNAQKLMVKSVHYNSIQEELAKLKDRLELAHHLATQSTWSSLKQLKKVVKALRGENANP
ncbi:hypothetical protein [Acinetobacter sp.]|uniref:hypothetical protein n=1 Tax=Acinetobacter sp. TaxID=472 RepID=UPI0024875353|nr:hypothetical protein [Acinetobacter sp.]MDI1222968.1 hypothetical protein [Acinetobacter sp.]